MTTAPHVPAPPQGPGVHPPFPAPPVEGRGKRIGMGLGIGAGVLVLVCGGGAAALFGLGASMNSALQERAYAAVRGYLGALHDGDVAKAYGLLCDSAQRDETQAEFRERIAAAQPIERYTLGTFDLVSVAVPVAATYADGNTANLEAYLDQDKDTGGFEVCELAE
jgi:hypothetical protein